MPPTLVSTSTSSTSPPFAPFLSHKVQNQLVQHAGVQRLRGLCRARPDSTHRPRSLPALAQRTSRSRQISCSHFINLQPIAISKRWYRQRDVNSSSPNRSRHLFPSLPAARSATSTRSPADQLLFVATDRISAFDHVLGSGIPDKGKILTQLSLFWFDFLKSTVPNHLITADAAQFPRELQPYLEPARRPQHARQASEDVPRRVCRPRLSSPAPAGRTTSKPAPSAASSCLPACANPIACPNPSSRPPPKINTGGHDENISYDAVEQTIGAAHADALRTLTLEIYDKATKHAASKGLILADTKFEFGLLGDTIILADEVLTPDSSRYWPAATYNPGGPQPSFDKQYVRDYLESIHWNKQAPAPALPDEVVSRTREKYLEAFRLITGRTDLANT